jgi:hypothetical protein
MGIETLQKAALAAGFVMATLDDDTVEEFHPETAESEFQPATGQWLVSLANVPRRPSPRDTLATAAAWIRHHLPLTGGRAPA